MNSSFLLKIVAVILVVTLGVFCEGDSQSTTFEIPTTTEIIKTSTTPKTTESSTTPKTTETSTTPKTTETSTTPKTTETTTTPKTTETSTTPKTTETTTTTPNTTKSSTTAKTTPQTTTPQHTTPVPIPNPRPVRNNFTVRDDNDNICIYMRAAFQISVTYVNNKTQNVTTLINVPELADNSSDVMGNCNMTQFGKPAQQLEISFFGNWSLTMTFTKPKSKLYLLTADDDGKFSLDAVDVTVVLERKLFPDVSDDWENRQLSAEVSNLTLFTGNPNGAYKCNSNETVVNKNGLTLFSSDLMYKAFGTSNSTEFGSDISECQDDQQTNSTVPIAVGAALAGLVVIVLIAYIIGRKRSRRSGYESV